MTKKLDGLFISNFLYKELNNYLSKKDKIPSIVSITIGNNYSNQLYSKIKQQTITTKTNIKFKNIHFEKITYIDLINYINKLNNNSEITGIIIQLPLPNYLKKYERKILDTINYKKDIDGLTSTSAGLLSVGEKSLIPCTALGIITILKSYNVNLEGKKVAILNRSNLIGKPLAQLLLKNNATPIICHSKTTNLIEITKNCDIIITAINKPEYIDSSYINNNSIVIDVGVNRTKLGKVVGDIAYQNIYPKASLITQPTGSIGPMTICMLAYNATKCLYQNEIDELLEKSITQIQKIK